MIGKVIKGAVIFVVSMKLSMWFFKAGKRAAKDEIELATLRAENEKLKEELKEN